MIPATLPGQPSVQGNPQHAYHVLGELILEELRPLQRMLLIADGTLTKLLEVYLNEPMRIVKLQEQVFAAPAAVEALELAAGDDIIARRILIQGQLTGISWLFADSIIVLDRLEKSFQDQLLNSHTPIGKLWLKHKTETFKEIITARREPAGELATHFHITPDAPLLSRTYRVFCHQQPVMLITEKFPENYFTA